MQIGRESPETADGSDVRSALTAAINRVDPTSMAAALGCTIGMAPSFLDFTFFRGIINPPAHKAEGLGCANDQFLNGIAGWRHHSQVRNSPWTRFFNGVTRHQNRNGRSLPGA